MILASGYDIIFSVVIFTALYAGVMELADVLDSKSSGSDTVSVRPRSPAPTPQFSLRGIFYLQENDEKALAYRN